MYSVEKYLLEAKMLVKNIMGTFIKDHLVSVTEDNHCRIFWYNVEHIFHLDIFLIDLVTMEMNPLYSNSIEGLYCTVRADWWGCLSFLRIRQTEHSTQSGLYKLNHFTSIQTAPL